MILSRHDMFGTAPFRALAMENALRPLTNAFCLIAAGQYVRADQDVAALDQTYLETTANEGVSINRFAITVSPRLIWQMMNLPPRATVAAATASTAVEPGRTALPANHHPAAQSQTLERSAQQPPPAIEKTSKLETSVDRFVALRVISQWLTSSPGDPRNEPSLDRRASTILANPSANEFGSEPMKYLNPSETVANDALNSPTSLHAVAYLPVGQEHATSSNHVSFLQATNERLTPRSVPARSVVEYDFAPVSLMFRTTSSPVAGGGAFPFPFPFVTAGDREGLGSRAASASELRQGGGEWSPANTTVLVSSAPCALAERLISSSPPNHPQYQSARDIRESLFAKGNFGGIAAAGMYGGADFVPTIFRAQASAGSGKIEQGPNSASLFVGAENAGEFAGTLVTRHLRTETDGAASPMPVPTVVRANPATAAPGAPHAPRESSPAMSPPPPRPEPFGLPADLMRQLTDQVVNALDSRTLAARERMGRF
ncbi:hypothetical protein [Zavarzinella formosa]|uniref:hypothetical protein n=1 Tax=Zavarzinella formosa TaxID=360055 RepID=UPI0002F80E95|nr:hypothetical protein [Zavarzinella formosa]